MGETRRIRIGNQSAFSAETITGPFEYAVASGFDAFEWFPDKKASGAGWEEGDIDTKTRQYIKGTALEHDIRLSVHAPWHLNALESGMRERLLETLAFATDIGAALINIHLYADQGAQAYVRAIVPLIRPFAERGMRLSVENTPLTGPREVNAFFDTLRALEPEAMAQVGMCLDLGHANLCEGTRNDYLKFVDLLDPTIPIIHVHLHENFGDSDSHLVLFTGPAKEDVSGIKGFIDRLKERGFLGAIILEQWPEKPALLKEARNRLREIIGP
ncbi:MAG: sugar phosphate isomerase/epimerase family protein [Thermodesulfobacteriota bacterium]|nr:sugar phosphate isomerase/epimerase family protein [Thermodesulfobacteriota bacterium]